MFLIIGGGDETRTKTCIGHLPRYRHAFKLFTTAAEGKRDWAKMVKANARNLVTQFDMYDSLRYILTGRLEDKSGIARPNLFRHYLGDRNCTDVGLPPPICGCEEFHKEPFEEKNGVDTNTQWYAECVQSVRGKNMDNLGFYGFCV